MALFLPLGILIVSIFSLFIQDAEATGFHTASGQLECNYRKGRKPDGDVHYIMHAKSKPGRALHECLLLCEMIDGCEVLRIDQDAKCHVGRKSAWPARRSGTDVEPPGSIYYFNVSCETSLATTNIPTSMAPPSTSVTAEGEATTIAQPYGSTEATTVHTHAETTPMHTSITTQSSEVSASTTALGSHSEVPTIATEPTVIEMTPVSESSSVASSTTVEVTQPVGTNESTSEASIQTSTSAVAGAILSSETEEPTSASSAESFSTSETVTPLHASSLLPSVPSYPTSATIEAGASEISESASTHSMGATEAVTEQNQTNIIATESTTPAAKSEPTSEANSPSTVQETTNEGNASAGHEESSTQTVGTEASSTVAATHRPPTTSSVEQQSTLEPSTSANPSAPPSFSQTTIPVTSLAPLSLPALLSTFASFLPYTASTPLSEVSSTEFQPVSTTQQHSTSVTAPEWSSTIAEQELSENKTSTEESVTSLSSSTSHEELLNKTSSHEPLTISLPTTSAGFVETSAVTTPAFTNSHPAPTKPTQRSCIVCSNTEITDVQSLVDESGVVTFANVSLLECQVRCFYAYGSEDRYSFLAYYEPRDAGHLTKCQIYLRGDSAAGDDKKSIIEKHENDQTRYLIRYYKNIDCHEQKSDMR